MGSPPYKVLGTILKMDKRGTQTNGPDDKKINDGAQSHPRDDIDRLYVSRKEGGRGRIEGSADASI